MIVGIILGDGSIVRRSSTSNARLVFAQSQANYDYFIYVFNLFSDYFTKDYNLIKRTNRNKVTGKVYHSNSFTTMLLPCFNKFHELFFSKDINRNIKIVPKTIENLLTPVSIAHWIMDDGENAYPGLRLNTYGFSDECIELLINCLTNKFYLNCTIQYHSSGPRIYILKSSMAHLKS